MRERIYYYRFDDNPVKSKKKWVKKSKFFQEVVVVKAPYTAPTNIWIKHNELPYTTDKWQRIPGHSFAWWWKWFKEIKSLAVEKREMTKTDWFAEVGLEQL